MTGQQRVGRTGFPKSAGFAPADPDYWDMQSAHEAGHATLAVVLGERVDAVYARIGKRSPNGKFLAGFFTRHQSTDIKAKLLISAAGAAGELVLTGTWQTGNAQPDRELLNEEGFSNFDYCVTAAAELLDQNRPLLTAARDAIKARMCSLGNGSQQQMAPGDLLLVSGEEIEKMFRSMGARRANCSHLNIETAKLRAPECEANES